MPGSRDGCRSVHVAALVLALLAAGVVPAGAAGLDATTLAIRASIVQQDHCADIQSSGTEDRLVAAGYAEVVQVWTEIDAYLQETPEPFLLYWRGVLAQCLGQAERAERDLGGFLDAAEFIDAVQAGRGQHLAQMVSDAKRRLRRIQAAAGGRPIAGTAAALDGPSPGVVMLASGGAVAMGGFVLHAGAYGAGRAETSEDRYWDQQAANRAGFVVGIAGASVGVGGIVALIAGRQGAGPVALSPGPVTTFTVTLPSRYAAGKGRWGRGRSMADRGIGLSVEDEP